MSSQSRAPRRHGGVQPGGQSRLITGKANSTHGSEKGVEKFLVIPIVVLILAQMGTSGDNGAVTLATKALTETLGATLPDIQLVNMVYSLMAGALMIAGGLAGTVIGWKNNFRLGAVLCAVGEFAMAFAPNISFFIWVGRVITGLGASFMIPSVLGLIPRIYQGKNRMVAFGAIGAATGISTLMPLLLGYVMDQAGFRITFGILGCYFLVVLGLSFLLPPVARDPKVKFDFLGTVLAAVGLFLLLIGLSRVPVWGLITAYDSAPFTIFGISPCLPLALAGLVVLAVMIVVEKKVEKTNGIALLPQSFIRTPQVLAGLVCSAAIFLFMMSMAGVLLTPWLQLVGGASALFAGCMVALIGVPMVIFSMGVPKYLPNIAPRNVLQAGYLLAAISIIFMYLAVHRDGMDMPMLVIGLLIAGIGLGLLSAYASSVVALALDERDAAQSGGVQATMRNVGQAVGVAVLGTVLLFGITSHINNDVKNSDVISAEVADAVSVRTITLTSDERFAQMISDIDMTQAEKDELITINADARVSGAHRTFALVGVLMLLALPTTLWVSKGTAPSGKKKAKDITPAKSVAEVGSN